MPKDDAKLNTELSSVFTPINATHQITNTQNTQLQVPTRIITHCNTNFAWIQEHITSFWCYNTTAKFDSITPQTVSFPSIVHLIKSHTCIKLFRARRIYNRQWLINILYTTRNVINSFGHTRWWHAHQQPENVLKNFLGVYKDSTCFLTEKIGVYGWT